MLHTPKQTEVEKKFEELRYLRGAQLLALRRFRLSLPLVYWPDLTGIEMMLKREVTVAVELEKLGLDSTQAESITDPKWR